MSEENSTLERNKKVAAVLLHLVDNEPEPIGVFVGTLLGDDHLKKIPNEVIKEFTNDDVKKYVAEVSDNDDVMFSLLRAKLALESSEKQEAFVEGLVRGLLNALGCHQQTGSGEEAVNDLHKAFEAYFKELNEYAKKVKLMEQEGPDTDTVH